MSFEDDKSYRGMFAEDLLYQVSWLPTSNCGDFGTLRVYSKKSIAYDIPFIVQLEELRPRGVDMPDALMKKAVWYANQLEIKKNLKLKDDNSNLVDVIDQRIHDGMKGSFAVDAQLKDDEPRMSPLINWGDPEGDLVEYVLYWFTGYFSSSGAVVYESKELAEHAKAMLHKNIEGVIVVLTPAQGAVPHDGDQE